MASGLDRIARVLALGLLCASTHTLAATFYIDPNATDDSGDGSRVHPRKYLGSASASMAKSGGDTLVLKPGVYEGPRNAVDLIRSGTPDAWNLVKAEVDGSVTLASELHLRLGDHYLRFEGLKWQSPTQKSVTGRYVKFLRCSFKDGPTTGNTMNLSIGTNDATPGAQYILVEDSAVYGAGGRYKVLVYNADKIILRRVVVRHGDGWSDTKGDPQAAVSLYNSTDVLTQNLLIVDSGAAGYFEAALYHPSNQRASRNIRNLGAIILNTKGTAVGWDDHLASSGNLLEDSIIWKATYAVSIGGAQHAGQLNRLTIGKTSRGGLADWNETGNFTLTNSLLWEVANNKLKAIQHSNNVCYATACAGEASISPAKSGLTWLPQAQPGSPLHTAGAQGGRVGATVVKRLGVSGTLYNEPGYDAVTDEALWPWPREAEIKKSMCVEAGISTDMCASASITHYVWEQLGSPMPSVLSKPR